MSVCIYIFFSLTFDMTLWLLHDMYHYIFLLFVDTFLKWIIYFKFIYNILYKLSLYRSFRLKFVEGYWFVRKLFDRTTVACYRLDNENDWNVNIFIDWNSKYCFITSCVYVYLFYALVKIEMNHHPFVRFLTCI